MSISRTFFVIIILLVFSIHLIIYYIDLDILLLYVTSILLGMISILIFFNFKSIKTLNINPIKLSIVNYIIKIYGLDKILLSSVFLIVLFMGDKMQSVRHLLFFIFEN
jgi:hypothetical protein